MYNKFNAMMYQKNKIKKVMIILSVFFGIASLGTIGWSIYLKNVMHRSMTFSQDSLRKPVNSTDIINVSVKRTNTWVEEDKSIVTAYDVIFINTKDFDFSNWEIKLQIPKGSFLENTWNCNAEIQKDELFITPKEKRNEIIKQNSQETFGFIIHSKAFFEFDCAEVSGTEIHHISKNFVFNICCLIMLILTSMLVISIIIYHSMLSQIKKHEQEMLHDSILIEQTMKTFTTFIDNKDPYTRGHSTRVAAYTKEIARRMGFNETETRNMYYAGLMHDIGKITISDEILNKTSHLSDNEWGLIKQHTANGAELLKNFTILPVINDAVLYHHERYDGNGYINRLKGDDIPIVARIVCVADSYDAMSANRCYRLKFSEERIIMELQRCAGKQFDPSVVEIMIEIIKDGTVYKL